MNNEPQPQDEPETKLARHIAMILIALSMLSLLHYWIFGGK